MKFLSRNTAGLNQLHRLHKTLRQACQMDVTFLQETKLQVSQTALVRSKWRSNHVFLSYSDTSRRGVMTLIHPRNDPVHLHDICDPNGQFHILVTKIT
jgi:exonuclease III